VLKKNKGGGGCKKAEFIKNHLKKYIVYKTIILTDFIKNKIYCSYKTTFRLFFTKKPLFFGFFTAKTLNFANFVPEKHLIS
jgi:hypothetical protein